MSSSSSFSITTAEPIAQPHLPPGARARVKRSLFASSGALLDPRARRKAEREAAASLARLCDGGGFWKKKNGSPTPAAAAVAAAAAAAASVAAIEPPRHIPRLFVDVRLAATLPGGRVAIEVLQAKDLMTSVEEEQVEEEGGFDHNADDGGDASSSSPLQRVPNGAARARARLLEAAGYRVLALDASKWLALRGGRRRGGEEEEDGGGGEGGAGSEEAARDEALAALLRPLLVSPDD